MFRREGAGTFRREGAGMMSRKSTGMIFVYEERIGLDSSTL